MSTKTTEITALLDLIIDGVGVVVDAEADGKVTLADAALLIKLVPDLGPAFQDIGGLPSELAGLDTATAEALVAHVMAKLTIADEHARAVVAASLKAAAAVYELVVAIKAIA